MLERLPYLLSRLRFEQRPIRVLAFVSRDDPEACANIESHENDKRRANAERHFATAPGHIRLGCQENLPRTVAHARVNLSRDRQLALQLLV